MSYISQQNIILKDHNLNNNHISAKDMHSKLSNLENSDFIQPHHRYAFEMCGQQIPNTPYIARCGKNYCPKCFIYKRRVKHIQQKGYTLDNILKKSGYSSQMVTIWYEDVATENLKSSYSKITEICTKLQNSRFYKNNFKGLIRGIETTVSANKLFHIHAHILLIYEPQDDLSEMLEQKILKFDNKIQYYANEALSKVNTTYFLAYLAKIPDIKATEWLEIRENQKKKQLITYSGCCKLSKYQPKKTHISITM